MVVLFFRPARLDGQIAPLEVAGFRQATAEVSHSILQSDERRAAQNANHGRRPLRARREWPSRRPAEQRDELAPSHSITSSALASSVVGTVRPSILAVWALMTSSNLDACTTGRSAGLAPLRIRPV